MNWEFVAAITGVLALVLTIFLEWSKIMDRLKSISPTIFSVCFIILLFFISGLSAGFIFSGSTTLNDRYISLVINVASNIITAIVLYYLMTKLLTDTVDKAICFFYWGVSIYFQLIFGYLLVFQPSIFS